MTGPASGDREEGGDDQPADRPAQQVDDVEHEHDAHDDEHVAGDRARGRVDFGHADPLYSGPAYPPNQRPRLRGYTASNQITIKVRDLKNLGKALDAIVKAGGNTINGISFGIDKPEQFQDTARVEAIKDAAKRAELYAQAVGYKVKRIVTVVENDYSPQPVPMMMGRCQVADAAQSTPVAAGEVSLTQTVSVTFELAK